MQEVDFAAGSITITKDRSDVVDFMTPFRFEPYSLMIRIPEENTWRVYTNLFSVSEMLDPIFGREIRIMVTTKQSGYQYENQRIIASI